MCSFFFFLLFLHFFSFLSFFSSLPPPPPPPPLPPSYPSHRLEPISPWCSGAPSGSSLPVTKLLVLPSGPFLPPSPPRFHFATLSSLLVSSRFAFGFFGLSLPPLLPLLNNCPPRGEDGTRLLRDLGPSSTTGGIERCISMHVSPLPRRKRCRIAEHFLLCL